MPKLKKIPDQISLDATELEKAWDKADKNHLCKNLALEFLLSGSLPYQLLNQQEHGTEINQDSDEDWSVISKNETERWLLETYKEPIGHGIRASFPDSILEPSPRDARTANILFYHFTNGKLDVTLGFPGVYNNFTFFMCPKTGEVITDPNNPDHAEDIRLFLEKGLIKSYKLDSIIRQAYSKTYSLNILAHIIKSYKIPIRSLNKSFHIDTAKTLHTLFTSHPVLMIELKQRLVEHYTKVNHKFADENDVSLFLDELKNKVASIVSPEPTEQAIKINTLERNLEKAQNLIELKNETIAKLESETSQFPEKIEKIERKLETAQGMIKAYENSAVGTESRVVPLENTIQKLQQQNSKLTQQNRTQGESLAKLEAEVAQLKKPAAPEKNVDHKKTRLLAQLISFIYMFLDRQKTNDEEQKFTLIFNEDEDEEQFKNITPDKLVALLATYALYQNLESDASLENNFNVFAAIIREVKNLANEELETVANSILTIDSMIMKANKMKYSSPTDPKIRLEMIKAEMARAMITTKLSERSTHDLINKLERINNLINHQETAQKSVLISMQRVDALAKLMIENSELLKNMRAELAATTNIEFNPAVRGFLRSQEEIFRGMDISRPEMCHAFSRYLEMGTSLSSDDLFCIFRYFSSYKKTNYIYEQSNTHIDRYYNDRGNLKDEKLMALATLTVKNIFAACKKSFIDYTHQNAIDIFFTNLSFRNNRLQRKGPPGDDALFTCLSPVLIKKTLDKLKFKKEPELANYALTLRTEILSHIKKINFFDMENEELNNNDDFLLDLHEEMIKCYVKYTLKNNYSYIEPYTAVLESILPLIHNKKPTDNAGLLTDQEKQLIYKARIFFVTDIDKAKTFKELLSKKMDNLNSHLKIGSVLIDHPDDLILTLSRAIRLMEPELLQTYKNPTDEQIQNLGEKLNQLGVAYRVDRDKKRIINDANNLSV